MTDYSELAKRLREHAENMYVDFLNEAADALEAQAQEIADKAARIAELEAALKPFAAMSLWTDAYPDGPIEATSTDKFVDVNWIVAARAALKGEK